MKNFNCLNRTVLLFILLTAMLTVTNAQQIEKSLVMSTGERIGFLEYKPKNYSTSGNVKYPVIIFLHGIGERGNGTTELKNVATVGLPKMIRDGHPMTFTWNGKTETFLVVSPQCPVSYGMWPQKMVNEFVEYVRKQLKSDTSRIYLTGLSMGGGGAYRYISTHADFPRRVSAVASVCPPCTFDNGEFVANAKLPVWGFHAANDDAAPASCTDRAMNRINAAQPEVKPIQTMWPSGGHAIWDRVYADTNYVYNEALNVYEWFLGQNKSLPVNKLPEANAGADQVISINQGTVTLNASASKDNDGKIIRYVWKKISGPNNGKITAVRSANPSTTVTGLTTTGVYSYELTVVDERAGFTKDTVNITVATNLPAPTPPNDIVVPTPVPPTDTIITPAPVDTVPAPQKPTVPENLPPITKTQGDVVVPIEWNWAPTVSGSPSKDPDGWIALFTWEKISGPDSYTIVSPRSCATKLENLVPGEYVFRVTAYDNKGASSYADVKVTVTQEKPKPPENLPPIAKTQGDVVVPIEWNWSPTVSGSPSKDPDGWIALFTWEKISGPDSYTIVSPRSCATKLENLVPGVYVFRVTAHDNKGATSYADVTVTVTQETKKQTMTSAATVSNVVVKEDPAAIPLTVLSMPAQLTAFPNPAVNMVNIQYTSSTSGKSVMSVFDVSGKVITNITFHKNEGKYMHNLDISRLVSGVYYVKIQTGVTTQLQTRFVKR